MDIAFKDLKVGEKFVFICFKPMPHTRSDFYKRFERMKTGTHSYIRTKSKEEVNIETDHQTLIVRRRTSIVI